MFPNGEIVMQSWVVWYTKSKEWRATKPMTEAEAKIFAENLQASGYRTQLVERPKITMQDILEG